MACAKIPQHILVTGIPGVGKTTLVQKVQQELAKQGISCQGFITEEVRSGGRRIGFDIVTTDSLRDQLARISQSTGGHPSPQQREFKVGQYSVNVVSFEQVALNVLTKKPIPSSSNGSPQKQIFVIDEIGKMELFSHRFIETVRKLLSQPSTMIIATIPVPKGRPIPFVEEVRSDPRSKLFEVTRENRDGILQDVLDSVFVSLDVDVNKNR